MSLTENLDIAKALENQIDLAKQASYKIATLNTQSKNQALEIIETELINSIEEIIAANKKDLDDPYNKDLHPTLKDRLMLNANRIESMASGIRKIISMKDPVGTILDGWQHPKGMRISKVMVPLGVIGIIYEARPNVTTDAVALAIKSGNALVLRGSRQAYYSNHKIMEVIYRAIAKTSIPKDAIQFLADKSREGCLAILKAKGKVDLVIPRGGESLNHFVVENSLIPVLGAGGGNCHIYIDKHKPDTKTIIDICINAKCSRPSVCNSTEKILIHKDIANEVLPELAKSLINTGVELRGDSRANQIEKSIIVNENEWGTEYLDLIIAIKIVDDIEEAIEHINKHSTGHSESILSEDYESINKFKAQINSACVYVNVSTRFTDGEEFGFGAEMGISTQKLHARGPIGAKELCTYKYIIEGEGQTR